MNAKKEQEEEEEQLGEEIDEGEHYEQVKRKMFHEILDLVNQEEERLPLWMLMSKRDKLDMLAHECIEAEAQILNFLIEVEFGAESNFQKEG